MADIRDRVDHWLWVGRFYKTRSLAATAVDGGKVHVNGTRVKRSKTIRVGDEVTLRKGAFEYVLTVTAFSPRRLGAAEAESLYQETDGSRARRERLADQHRLSHEMEMQRPRGRPTKRDRRALRKFKEDG